jgi:hypothetical protein
MDSDVEDGATGTMRNSCRDYEVILGLSQCPKNVNALNLGGNSTAADTILGLQALPRFDSLDASD